MLETIARILLIIGILIGAFCILRGIRQFAWGNQKARKETFLFDYIDWCLYYRYWKQNLLSGIALIVFCIWVWRMI